MNSKLKDLIDKIANQEALISLERRNELDDLALIITEQLREENSLDITVVCTHNSRRSQLGEVWINTLAPYFGINNITAYSGGMEETAFNYRMVNALTEAGFNIEMISDGSNPKYILGNSDLENHPLFSKIYNDPMNPQSGYMALMVCGHADENCPIVHGMKYRIPLRYKDPKAADDTEQEGVVYHEKVEEIGREIYYLLKRVNLHS